MEKWVSIKGYEGVYEISDTGEVRSLDRVVILKNKLLQDRPCLFKGRVLKKCINAKGYYSVVLSSKGKTSTKEIHRLIGINILGVRNKTQVINHIDGNKLNNDIKNLEIVTLAENIRHAFKTGLIKTKKPVIKLDKITMEELEEFAGEAEACRSLGITKDKISRAIKRNGTCGGFKWKWK